MATQRPWTPRVEVVVWHGGRKEGAKGREGVGRYGMCNKVPEGCTLAEQCTQAMSMVVGKLKPGNVWQLAYTMSVNHVYRSVLPRPSSAMGGKACWKGRWGNVQNVVVVVWTPPPEPSSPVRAWYGSRGAARILSHIISSHHLHHWLPEPLH